MCDIFYNLIYNVKYQKQVIHHNCIVFLWVVGSYEGGESGSLSKPDQSIWWKKLGSEIFKIHSYTPETAKS